MQYDLLGLFHFSLYCCVELISYAIAHRLHNNSMKIKSKNKKKKKKREKLQQKSARREKRTQHHWPQNDSESIAYVVCGSLRNESIVLRRTRDELDLGTPAQCTAPFLANLFERSEILMCITK